jgi:copper transport protein
MKQKKAGAIAFIILVASLMITGKALAHALLVRSLPATDAELIQPPKTIEMWFSEPLEAKFSSARLLATNGEEITVGATTVDPNDPTHLTVPLNQLLPGVYTVAWVSLSRADGHEWYGSFPFTVLNPDGSHPAGVATTLDLETDTGLPTFAQTVSRWLALVGSILFMSVPLFLKFVVTDMARSGENAELDVRLRLLGVKIVGLAIAAIIIGSWLQFALQASQLGDITLLPRLIYGTHTGALALARQTFALCGLLVMLALVQPSILRGGIFIVLSALEISLMLLTLISGFQGEGMLASSTLILTGAVSILGWYRYRRSDSARSQPWTPLLVLGLVILLLFSSGSHASAVPGSFWAVLSDYIHLLATSGWLGGLMLLPIMLEQMRRSFPSLDRSHLGPLFRRYGNMAKFSFFLLITTGLFNSLVQLPTFISIINTVYGRVLLIKLLLLIAVWRISILSSRILRGPADPSGLSANLQRFNQQVGLAALLGLVLMVSVAALVQTQPPTNVTAISPETSLPYHSQIQADDLTMHVLVTPNQLGNNQFKVFLSHADGSPIGEVQLVRIIFNYQDAKIGQSIADLNQLGVDVFGIEGAYLNQPGKWNLSIYVRRRGLDDVISDLQLKVPEPANTAKSINPFQNPVSTTPVGGLLAGAMIILGFETYRWRRTLEQVQPKLFPIFMLIAGILFIIGVATLSYVLGSNSVAQIPGN